MAHPRVTVATRGGILSNSRTPTPTAPVTPSASSYRCPKCRTTLFTASDVVAHDPADARAAHVRFRHKGVANTSVCTVLNVAPNLPWLAEEVARGEVEGKMVCGGTLRNGAKCGAKVGEYHWQGSTCTCGQWVAPAFLVPRSKVDAVVTAPVAGAGTVAGAAARENHARQQAIMDQYPVSGHATPYPPVPYPPVPYPPVNAMPPNGTPGAGAPGSVHSSREQMPDARGPQLNTGSSASLRQNPPQPAQPAQPALPPRDATAVKPHGGSKLAKWPVALAMGMIVTALVAAIVPVLLVYQKTTATRELARYSLAAAAVARGSAPPRDYLGMEVRVSNVDVVQGVGTLALTKITPYGRFAVGGASAFLHEDMDLVVNGNRFTLYAGTPAQEIDATFTFTGGQASMYPFNSHTATVNLYAITESDRQQLAADLAAGNPPSPQTLVPLDLTVVGGAQPVALNVTVGTTGRSGALMAIALTVAQTPLTMAFSGMVFAAMWLVALTTVALAIDAVWSARKVDARAVVMGGIVLAAMPLVRNSQPGVGPMGSVVDLAGLYWNVGLVALALILVTISWMAQLRDSSKAAQTQQQQQQQAKVDEQYVARVDPMEPPTKTMM
ncbi:tyrosine protein phosphatase yvh1 [Allomyces arbusculus]|nr:tyrosine protein phosphatase yvh1 [Allomyces arbusculus]